MCHEWTNVGLLKLELSSRLHIEIVWTWLGWQIVVMTAFAIAWMDFSSTGLERGPSGTKWPCISPVHVAVDRHHVYVVAGWLNRTRITVGNGKVAVRHRPIPWFGNADIDTSNLKQLYTKEHPSRTATATRPRSRAVTQTVGMHGL